MDTETFLPLENVDLDKISIFEFDEDTQAIFDGFIELTRHLQELNQLFRMFCFNLESMNTCYHAEGLDILERNPQFNTKYPDFIVINALTTNFISSGRVVLESIESCLKNTFGDDSEEYTNFKKDYISTIYDNSFVYRFFYDMRNFVQHLHLMVSMQDGTVSFDINQILSTPHYKMKKDLQEILSKSNSECIEKNGDVLRLSFCIAISEYICLVSNIYSSFLDYIKPTLCKFDEIIKEIVQKHPEITKHENSDFDGNIFFMDDNDFVHSFYAGSNPKKMLEIHLEEANKFYEEHWINHNKLLNSLKKETSEL